MQRLSIPSAIAMALTLDQAHKHGGIPLQSLRADVRRRLTGSPKPRHSSAPLLCTEAKECARRLRQQERVEANRARRQAHREAIALAESRKRERPALSMAATGESAG